MNTTNLHLILINLFIVLFSFTMMGCNKVTDNPAPGGDHQIWDSIVNKEWSNLDNWAGTGLYFYEEENNLYCIYMVYGSGVPVAYHFTSSVSINEDEIKIFLPINIESGTFNNELDEKEVKEILFKFEDNTIKYGDLQFNISNFNSIAFITSKKE